MVIYFLVNLYNQSLAKTEEELVKKEDAAIDFLNTIWKKTHTTKPFKVPKPRPKKSQTKIKISQKLIQKQKTKGIKKNSKKFVVRGHCHGTGPGERGKNGRFKLKKKRSKNKKKNEESEEIF